jgi:hypothetical protein
VSCGLSFGSGSDESESIFFREITVGTGVLRNHGATQGEKSRSAVTDPSCAPGDVNAFDCREFRQRTRQITSIGPSGARDLVWINNFPAEL